MEIHEEIIAKTEARKRHEILMGLKNDKERTAFLEDYRNEENGWKIWDTAVKGQRIWWEWEFPDGIGSILVEEKFWQSEWPKRKREWIPCEWFLLRDDGEPLANQHASKTQALEEIKAYVRTMKEAQKNGKEG